MVDSNDTRWRVADPVRIIPYPDERPDENFFVVVNVANKRWLKITTQAHEFLLQCSAGRPLGLVTGEMSRRFGVGEAELVGLHEQFVKQGFLAPRDSEQEAGVGRGAPSGRVVVYLNVTERCNLQCPTCYFNARPDGADPLSLEEINRISDSLAADGVTDVVISGGEPFVRPDIYEILEHARPLFKKVYLLSNGIALAQSQRCERLKGLADRVQVSIDGSCAEVHERIRGKGTFAPTIQAVRNLKEAGIPEVSVSFTLNSLNAHDAANAMELASDLGVRFDFSRFTPTGRGYRNQCRLAITPEQALAVFRGVQERALQTERIQLGTLYQQLGQPVRLKCGAGDTTFFSIAPDGSVYPCHVMHQPQFYMGNALQDGSIRATIARSPVAGRFRALEVDSRARCRECSVRYFCGGGCPANSEAAHDDIAGLDPFCSFYYRFEMAMIAGWRTDLPPVTNIKRIVERLQ